MLFHAWSHGKHHTEGLCPMDADSPPTDPGEARPNPAFLILSLWWACQRAWGVVGHGQHTRDITLQKHSGWFSFIANIKNVPPIFFSKGGSPFSPNLGAAAENLSNRDSSVRRRTSGKDDSNSWEREMGTSLLCPPSLAATANTVVMASLVRLWRYWGRPGTVKV